MHRSFRLREVSVRDFNIFCEQVDVRLEDTSRCSLPGKIYSMGVGFLNYHGLGELLDSLEDDKQVVRSVWPKGFMAAGEATRVTLSEGRGEHYSYLLANENKLGKIIVQLCTNCRKTGGGNADIFEFHRENWGHELQWMLRFFCLRQRNIQFYQINGLGGGIYTNPPKTISAVFPEGVQ